jgi:hypothetical protein
VLQAFLLNERGRRTKLPPQPWRSRREPAPWIRVTSNGVLQLV